MRYLTPFIAIGLLAGCDTASDVSQTTGVADLPLLGGYRDPADECEKLGENALTVDYLDHTADLVACPADYEGLGVFTVDTGGVEVARIDGWVLFSVAR